MPGWLEMYLWGLVGFCATVATLTTVVGMLMLWVRWGAAANEQERRK